MTPNLPSISNNISQVLIDFGLAYQSSLVEDRAVDLYVLERAFASTHPDSEQFFIQVMYGYKQRIGNKLWSAISKRLEEGEFVEVSYDGSTAHHSVRLRGRKRSMVG